MGEALFDCFPNRTTLGGAPVNMAVHANALLSRVGGAGLPATRVGRDELGDRFFDELRSRGVPTDAVQVDPMADTGRVLVDVDRQGNAAYRFAADTAWERLEFTPEWRGLAENCDGVVFGTLAQRSAASRETIGRFLEAASRVVRLLDVNLRGDYYSAEVLASSLELASAVKLNEEELPRVLGLLALPSEGGEGNRVDRQAARLLQAFGLDWLALTRGKKGTVLYHGDERHDTTAPALAGAHEPTADADSVGAGDACCAGLMVGVLMGWPPPRTLALANAVGAYVASQPGATPTLPDALLAPLLDAPDRDGL